MDFLKYKLNFSFVLFILFILLEFVQLSEAYRYVQPWRPHRHRLRQPPFAHRPPKRRYKKWRPKRHRNPRWHPHRYAPGYIDNDEPYTIEIELPKYPHNRNELSDHHSNSYYRGRDYEPYPLSVETQDPSDRFVRTKMKKVIKLNGKSGKPKLRIKISRSDYLNSLVHLKNLKANNSIDKLGTAVNHTVEPWTKTPSHDRNAYSTTS